MNKKEIKSLLRKYFSDECNERELEQVKVLLKSGKHEQLWKEALDESTMDHLLTDKTYDFENKKSLFQKVELTIDKEQYFENQHHKSQIQRYLKAAAVISLLLLSAAMFFLFPTEKPVAEVSWKEYKTTADQWRKIKLSDGSRIWLNANTIIKLPEKFLNNKREIYLSGEAFFSVEKDSLRPFIVYTDDVQTSVLGTSFNINTQHENVQVTVATGKVKVTQVDSLTNEKRPLALLTPNQQLTYERSDQNVLVGEVDALLTINWKKDVLEFKNEPLEKVIKVLENYFGISIELKNKHIKNCQLTATFRRHDSLEKVLNTIQQISNIDYQIDQKKISLSGNGCNSTYP